MESRPISRQTLESLVAKGICAPSGDNLQPWKFRLRENAIDLYIDGTRTSDLFDAGFRATYLSIGAVIENVALAASHDGYRTSVRYLPNGQAIGSPAATLTLESSNEPEDPLCRQIENRLTNRRFYLRRAVPAQVLERLTQVGTAPGQARLILVSSGRRKRQLTHLIGQADQIRFENEKIHRYFFETVRFKKEEAERSRDGIDLRTLELDPLQRRVIRLVSRWERMRWLNKLGVSKSFNLYAQFQVAGSPVLGLLASEGTAPLDYLKGGRLMQRVLLKIAEEGLSVQPMMAIPIFIINLQVNGGIFFPSRQRAQLLKIKEQFFRLFDLNDKAGLILLFRLGYAPAPTARSLRRPVSDFLT